MTTKIEVCGKILTVGNVYAVVYSVGRQSGFSSFLRLSTTGFKAYGSRENLIYTDQVTSVKGINGEELEVNFAGFPLEPDKTYIANGIAFVIKKLLTGEYVAVETDFGGHWISEKDFDRNQKIYHHNEEIKPL